jgi:hypothetical protein
MSPPRGRGRGELNDRLTKPSIDLARMGIKFASNHRSGETHGGIRGAR